MADNQIQTPFRCDGSTSEQRMEQAGYNNIASYGENAYAYATSAEQAMQAFLIDWGVPSDGHRINIQQPGVSPQTHFVTRASASSRPTPATRLSAPWS